MPFGLEQSFLHPYIDLLTTEQAMADFAQLITHQRALLKAKDCPVIAFGGSYGGMLAAYMRFRYPQLVAGSIAASAPVRLVAGQADPHGYWSTTTKDYQEAMPGCDNQIRKAYQQMALLAQHGDTGLKRLSSQFNLCSPVTNNKQYHHLVRWTINAFGTAAMMDYPYPTSFMSKLPGNPVKVQCKRLLGASTPLDGLSSAVALFYGDTVKCNDIYTDFIDCADPTGCGSGPDSKAWDYQSCTEFRMPTGTNNVTDMFPAETHTRQWREEYCHDTWRVKPRDGWAAISFWGEDISAASNIVFSNGLLDPWHSGGILKDVSESVVAILIEGGAHHLDLRASNPADPPSVVAARLTEQQHITRWVRQARHRHRNNPAAKSSTREALKELLLRWANEDDAL